MKHTILLLFLIATQAFATQQFSETIYYMGRARQMQECPLDAYLECIYPRPKVVSSSPSTALYRGYEGTWQIDKGYLWLVSYETCEPEDLEMKKRAFIRLNKWWWRGPVKAEWYTGELYIPDGKKAQLPPEFEMGGISYEHYLAIRIKKGTVTKVRRIDRITKQKEDRARWDRPVLTEIGPDVKLKTVEFYPSWHGSIVGMAGMNYVTEEALRKLNGLGPDETVEAGTPLKVPAYYQ